MARQTGEIPLRVFCFPNEVSFEETKFSFSSGYQLGIASGLGMDAYIHFSFQL